MRHGSLFSGIGGFDLAAEWMGWENVFHCEWNEFGQKILKHYWPKAISYGDITKTDFTIHRGTIDVLTGGFPCQDISFANPKAIGIQGKRSGLWSQYARAIREIRPRFVVFENSPMLVVRGFERVLQDFSGMGYDVEWRSFYASEYGFPHHRKRIYGVAYAPGLRPENFIKEGGIIHKSLYHFNKKGCYENEATNLPLSLKRFNSKSNFENIQLHDGFSKELDKDSIMGFGNAVVPTIPFSIFKAIEQYNNVSTPSSKQHEKKIAK